MFVNALFTQKKYAIWVFLSVIFTSLFFPSGAQLTDDNPFRHNDILDKEGKYSMAWFADFAEKRVVFNVTVQTTGYVGLGLSVKGKMAGADIVIGGVTSDGKPYFSDMHAVGNHLPQVDSRQDWTLHSAWERDGTTFLSFSRPFDTCDNQDLEIHDDVIALIWAYGEKDDEFEYHHQNRGQYDVYLLDPDLTPRAVQAFHRTNEPTDPNVAGDDVKVWTISDTHEIAVKDTTYICTVHKAPMSPRKQHIVGFRSILASDVERRHIHHYLLHRCHAPPGQDPVPLFQSHVDNSTKEECYILAEPAGTIPTHHCREVYHVWAVGGRPAYFPEHVGMPMSESPNDYYMLQMHFDNPELIPGIQVKYSLEIFYTDNLRTHDAGMMMVGELTPASPSIMVPPHSLAHLIYGHCGSGCTSKLFPDSGIHVFATNLHTHLAGRGTRLLHIRNDKELPWISYDDNYNFNFQQIRILREELTIFPGDILINRCVYSNTDRNGSVTIGGFRTRNEMCNGFLWYYNKIPSYSICRSELRSEVYKDFVQVWNTTWSNERIENIVTAPAHNAGLAVSEVGNERLEWTIDTRNQIQKYHRSLPQITQCAIIYETENSNSITTRPPLQRSSAFTGTTGRPVQSSIAGEILDPEHEFVSIYPEDIVPYERPRFCQNRKRKHKYWQNALPQ